MPPKPTTWTETLEKQFLLDIIDRTETKVSSAVFDDIADKYGKPHTRGSLQKKFMRMKAIAAEDAKAGDSGDTKTGDKRKTNEGEGEDADATGTKSKKAKTLKTKQGAKIKAEGSH